MSEHPTKLMQEDVFVMAHHSVLSSGPTRRFMSRPLRKLLSIGAVRRGGGEEGWAKFSDEEKVCEYLYYFETLLSRPQVEVFGLRPFTRNTSRKSLLNRKSLI